MWSRGVWCLLGFREVNSELRLVVTTQSFAEITELATLDSFSTTQPNPLERGVVYFCQHRNEKFVLEVTLSNVLYLLPLAV